MTRAAQISAGIRAATGQRADAWRFLTDFAAEWRAPLGSDDGYGAAELEQAEHRLGIRLPSALREAYLLFGRRDDLSRNQDRLQRPEELYLSQGALVYHTENQGAAEWGIRLVDLEAEDPATFYRTSLADRAAQRWEPWTERVSTALVELVMSETALYEADGLSDSADLVEGLSAGFEPLPAVLPEHHGSTWFLGEDVLAHVLDRCWLTVRARSPEALEAVRENVALDWINW